MSQKPILKAKHVALRALEPTDLDIIMRWENDTEVWAVSNTLAPYSRQRIWQYLESYDGDIYASRQLRLIITRVDTGEPVGCADITDFDPVNNRAEIGLLIAPEHRGRGFADEAIELLKLYGTDWLGINQLYIIVADGFQHVAQLFVRHGFEHTATFKKWVRTGREYRDAMLLQYFFDSHTKDHIE